MLESAGVLRTWALAELPRDWETLGADASGEAGARPKIAGTNTVSAERLADHRLAYLDYEGPVSGHRGSVVRLDRGTYETRSESNDCWEVTLKGEFLRGQIVLQQCEDGSEMWQLTMRKR